MKQSGVYLIINTISGRLYVGSSSDIQTRWRKHREALKRNQHVNVLLQRAWDKYDESAFQLVILEQGGSIREREQHWLDFFQSYKPEHGYNRSADAQKRKGLHLLPEQKETLRRVTTPHLKALAQGQRKLSNQQVTDVFERYIAGDSLQKVSDTFGLSRETVSWILDRKSYQDVSVDNELIEKVKELRQKNINRRAYGTAVRTSKLSVEDVRTIRHLRADGMPIKRLVEQFQVTEAMIGRIVRRTSWKRVN